PRHGIRRSNGAPGHEGDDLFLGLGTLLAGSKVMLEVRKPGGPAREKVEVTLARFQIAGKPIATEKRTRPFVRGLRVDYTSLLVQGPHPVAQRIPHGVLVGA